MIYGRNDASRTVERPLIYEGTQMSKFDSMGKEGLRSACREAGISYGKLNNDGMRAALKEKHEGLKKTETSGKAIMGGGHAPSGISSLVNQLMGANSKKKEERIVPAAAKRTSSGLKIEKSREERNGVKRPSVGGMCRAVWDALDSVVTDGKSPSAKDVKALAEKNSWNPNNASIEFYQWRRFNGITGRQI